MNNRSLGALLGVAVGDALGTTLEFSRPNCDHAPFPTKLTGPLTDIRGGGPFNVGLGQVTDDTQMAVALATSLSECKKFDSEDVALRYREWRSHAFDVGGQTGGSISAQSRVPEGSLWTAGYEHWRHSRSGAGNGSLMRTAPIGVYFAYDDHKRTEASVIDSAITHADPRCLLACNAYNWAVARAVRGARAVYQLFASAERGIEDALRFIKNHDVTKHWYTEKELTEARRDLYGDLSAADKDKIELMSMLHGSSGFVRTAFRYAFWAVRHAVTYREAIIDVVNRGGDSDTNGAIVGGLLGAWFGSAGIPEEWVSKVEQAVSDRPESVWWTTYHPSLMLHIADINA